jgi:aspartyl-tRNA(Asn)/glutamyl-tRNA(Gln) amidotransferase subunit B
MHSSDEVWAFLDSLRIHLRYAGVSDCDLEKGQMRCDVNVSLRPAGAAEYGTRVEYKNLNSISGARRAVSHEMERQKKILENGGTISRETRRWNAERGNSESLRTKEMVKDYCYFPDPDLQAVEVGNLLPGELECALPERPFDRQRRFMESFGLPFTLTSVLCPSRALGDYFESAVRFHPNARAIANFIVNDLLREVSADAPGGKKFPISPEDLASLVRAVDEKRISRQTAQDIFGELYHSPSTLEAVLGRFQKKNDQSEVDVQRLCQRALEENSRAVEEFRNGKANAINALKGYVMKHSNGKAHPEEVDRILKESLAH